MIRERVVGPCGRREERLPPLDDALEAVGLPGLLEEVEVERELQLVVRSVVPNQATKVAHPDLTDGHALAGVRVEDLAPTAVDLMDLVEIPVAKPRPTAESQPWIVPELLVADQP